MNENQKLALGTVISLAWLALANAGRKKMVKSGRVKSYWYGFPRKKGTYTKEETK